MTASGQMGGAADAKRLVENLLSDMRSLSAEAKKKHVQVKEAAESGLVKIRNINTGSNDQNLLTNLRSASSELVQPLIMGCSSKNARLVQISLQAMQKMVQHRVVEPTVVPVIVNELWALMEAECEELRVLQTLTPLVSTELLVCGQWLAKCLAICFRLNFAKDPIVINTASATVRQMVSCVFERVIQEDGMKGGELPIVRQTVKLNARAAPPTLRPCAADGYLLFKDLCVLINAGEPCWMVGITEMTRTLGLELLESVLAGFPSIFVKHTEFAQLLKDQVCPLVIRLFAPSYKHISLPSQHPHSSSSRTSIESATVGQVPSSPDRPSFPISMRLLRVVVVLVTNFYQLLVTECEIFLSLLLKFLDFDKLGWQRAIALEVLHRIVVQPDLILWFCENYDARASSTKVVYSIISSLAAYVQLSFLRPDLTNKATKDEEQFDVTTQTIAQSGFLYRGIWIPFYQNISSKKSILLDLLDKHDAIVLPEGYALSLTYICVTDCCQCIFQAVDSVAQNNLSDSISKELFQSTYASLLAAMSLLLEASIDESVTEHLLKSFSTVAMLSCRLGHTTGRDATVFALCKAALPPNYLVRVLGGTAGLNVIPGSVTSAGEKDLSKVTKSGAETFESESTIGQPIEVVAVGTVCPTPSLPAYLYSIPVTLTAKNVQVSRVLIGCTQMNGQSLGDCWHLVLASLQHLLWILSMQPSSQGGIRTEGESGDYGSALSSEAALAAYSPSSLAGTSNVLKNTVLADVSVMAAMLDNLFESSVKLDDVGLHHMIAALCKLSSEAMMVSQSGREPSFFPLAKLLKTGVANLSRIEVFWKPVTAHLVEICGHSYAKLRAWGCIALTTLINYAVLARVDGNEMKRQPLILAPLLAVREVEYADVRRRQIDCLIKLLQSAGQQLTPDQWPTVIEIIAAIVNQRFNFDESLIKLSYSAVALIVTDFLELLPLNCLQMLVETDAKYGAQQCELNISLSALGQLWTISDFVYRKAPHLLVKDTETIWLVLYNCLSELCVDVRPPVRKSACQTLLQTVAAHGNAFTGWKDMIFKILFPMLDKVRALTRNASTMRSDSAALGASNMLIHHSRDTESKQWAETSVQTLAAVAKIFTVQRPYFNTIGDHNLAWTTLLNYVEYLAKCESHEMSLAALKTFQELLVGSKVSAPSANANARQRSTSLPRRAPVDEETSVFTDVLWVTSWKTWIQIARHLITARPLSPPIRDITTEEQRMKAPVRQYIPGPAHLTTVLQIFPALFPRMKRWITADDFKRDGVLAIFKGIVSVPISNDQSPFILPTSADITPTQEAVLECVKILYQEMIDPSSSLRPALPDLIRLMVDFSSLSVRPPTTEFLIVKDDNWSTQNLVPFGELAMRTMVDIYATTAHFQEIIQSTMVVEIVRCLAQPMELKYECASQGTWKAAVSLFSVVLRLGLPSALQQPGLFRNLWPAIADACEGFLFGHSRPPTPLNADERKRHEFIDCQLIELIRGEILPHVSLLPTEFVHRIIELLNRGSISSIDPSDVLASDSYLQRAELSRICFDALLSMSQNETPDVVRGTYAHERMLNRNDGVLREIGTSTEDLARIIQPTTSSLPPALPSQSTSRLGTSAIDSLLIRCRQVMESFVHDEQSAGELRLPQQRVLEMLSVLRAVSALTEGLAGRNNALSSRFYGELVSLYPVVVDCVPCAKSDLQVENCLVEALKSYQSLLSLKAHK